MRLKFPQVQWNCVPVEFANRMGRNDITDFNSDVP